MTTKTFPASPMMLLALLLTTSAAGVMGALVGSPPQAGASTATIAVGARPVGAAVDPTTDTVYVANANSNTVSVIDGSTNAVTATISVGTYPTGVAVDPVTDTVYVANRTSNTVSVIDGSTDAVTATISVGKNPERVAVDPATDTVYVTNYSSGTVSVIDGSTDAVTATISAGLRPTGVAVDPVTDTVYVTNLNPHTVSVIDGSTDAVTATISVGTVTLPWGVAVDPTTDTVYVANWGNTARGSLSIRQPIPSTHTVSVIDGSTNAVTTTVTVGTRPVGVAVDPATDTVYVANADSDTVSVIDGSTNAVTSIISVGTYPTGVAVDPTTDTVYVTNYSSGTVSYADVVGTPPTISASKSSVTVATGQAMAPIAFNVTGTPAPTCSKSGTLPAGANLSSSCVLSGTLTQSGTYPITVTASNGVAPSASVGFTLTVDVAPTISAPESSATTTVGQAMAPIALNVTGTPAPTITETGSLSAGVSLSRSYVLFGTSSYVLFGVPTAAGAFRFTVTASNGIGSDAVKSFVLVVRPSGPGYHFAGVLSGALHDKILSLVSPRAVRVVASGKALLTLQSDFGFSVGARLGRVHVVIQRDVRTLKVPETVHGQRRLVARRVFFYAGVLVLVEPAHHGALVFHSFADVSFTDKRVHAVAIGDLVTSVRVRVRAKVHGQERLVWRVRKLAHPLRLAIEMAPSVS